MKRFALLIVVLACWSIPSFAADVPFSEVFGGVSLNHRSNANNSLTYTGWQANAAFNFHKAIGVVADFAGEYKKDEDSQHHFMFGPRFNVRKSRVNYFAEALFGGDHVPEQTLFSMAYGGGIDVHAGKVSIRVIQFDWVPVRLGNDLPWLKNNTRFGFGVVIPFGMTK